MSDYHNTTLWMKAFESPKNDKHKAARVFFSEAYERFREKTIPLVSRIATELPQLTVHDITHLDALWETASEIAGKGYELNPAEAFVLGGSILLHDAAMCAAAYRNGIEEIKATTDWRDCAIPILRTEDREPSEDEIANPGEKAFEQIMFAVLRDRHAAQAELLATMAWPVPDSSGEMFLIDNPELRTHYGEPIGQIAHSHHWNTAQLADSLQREIPAIALSTLAIPNSWTVDCVKIACLLRCADAAHIDARRAPRQYRIFARPTGISAEHWKFQERLGKARLEKRHNALRYGSGKRFDLTDAESWWLCFDTVQMIDRELRDCDKLLSSCELQRFAAQYVLDSETPSLLARHVQTLGWTPVDARIQISDVTNIVKRFGGEELYGKNPSAALRELIQNSADAVRARRKLEKNSELGRISVRLRRDGDDLWLDVEDDGVGMAQHILTGPLLDFGKSFWRSSALHREWPGLAGSGFLPTGKFGIGFFSVFMLGDHVCVTTRRFDQGVDRAKTLEFRFGLNLRPILRSADPYGCVLHGGTCVSVKLNAKSHFDGNLLRMIRQYGQATPAKLDRLVAWLCPSLDVDVWVRDKAEHEMQVISANDWTNIPSIELVHRVSGSAFDEDAYRAGLSRVRLIQGADGKVFGRCGLVPELWLIDDTYSSICVDGLRSISLRQIIGLLVGTTSVLNRQDAQITIPKDAVSAWASDQEVELLKLPLPLQADGAGTIAFLGARCEHLKWCRFGGIACTTAELEQRLSTANSVVLHESISERRYAPQAQVEDRVTAKQLVDFFVPAVTLPPRTNPG